MAQTFTLDRHTDPSNPTAVPANNELIKNYETISDMESDLTNVDDGEVISTEEADYTSIHVSDEVTDGDLNPVTSNAVYDAIEAAKIDRVKGAFVEERTNKLWTDGRPIYRMYVEGSPEPTLSEDRKTFMLYAPVSSAGAVKVVDMYGYWEITENTAFPQIVGMNEQISSAAMTPSRVHATSMCSTASWDPRYPDRLSIGVSVNATTSYGKSEHIKICAVIEYTKMSDTPVEDPGVGPLTPSSGNIAGVIVNDGIHYSATETPTGGTWIDGKPIYRKVFRGTTTDITAAGSRVTAHLIGDSSIAYDHLVSFNGTATWVRWPGDANEDHLEMSLNTCNVSGSLQAQFGAAVMIIKQQGPGSAGPVNSLQVYCQFIRESSNQTSMDYQIVVEYTKL